MKDKILEVSALENGTVIDHIPSESLFEVISILNIYNVKSMMTFGTNLESKKLGTKAIIKISDVYFQDHEINKISLVAPQARLNIIKNYKVVEKKIVEIPDDIISIVKCMNPQCITNHEKIITRFKVVSKEQVKLKCHYCEKITDKDHIEIL